MQQAAAALEEASQSSDSQRHACAGVAAALAKEPVSGHKDKVTIAAVTAQRCQGWQAGLPGSHTQRLLGLSDQMLTICTPCDVSQDVKTYTAFCLAHVLRLHTADCPYSASQQQVCYLRAFYSCEHCTHALCFELSVECDLTMLQLQGIFGLFMWVFRRLENANAPSFQMCHSILDVVSQVCLHEISSSGCIAIAWCPALCRCDHIVQPLA